MKTTRYRVAARAEADLEDIWVYIAEHNFDAAAALMEKLRQRFASLARTPGIGRDESTFAPTCEASQWAATSSFTAKWSQALKLCGCCTER